MSYVSVNHHPCMGMVNNKNADVCTSMVGANARRTKPGASDGRDSLISIDHVLITETQQVKVSYFPNHPLQKQVTVTNSSTVTTYQLYKDSPSRLYCRASASGGDHEMDLQSLHFLGTHTHENVPIRKWAARVLNDTQVNDVAPVMMHTQTQTHAHTLSPPPPCCLLCFIFVADAPAQSQFDHNA